MLAATDLEKALAALGELLADRGHHYEVVAIGGGALAILGLVERSTRDLDVIALVERGTLASAVDLPAPLAEAIADVARAYDLSAEWLNSAPAHQLERGLPVGFFERCMRRAFGGLVVWFASRIDLVHLKLYAAVEDRLGGKHFHDLRQLAPTAEELKRAAAWVRTQNGSETFARSLRECLGSLSNRDG
jgi:uncharacterized nucleotidyltransferase DUF6036